MPARRRHRLTQRQKVARTEDREVLRALGPAKSSFIVLRSENTWHFVSRSYDVNEYVAGYVPALQFAHTMHKRGPSKPKTWLQRLFG
jgi:hypothetical protein